MNKTKKGGRPRKDASEKLKYKVTIKLCMKDYYSLLSAAKTAGIKSATLARSAIMGIKINPRLSEEQAG